MESDPLIIAGRGFRSRLMVGTGKFPSAEALRAALEASGSFTNFATEYLSKHKVTDDFEVSSNVLDDFRLYLSERQIQPSVSEWVVERPFLENRLKTEIFNQAFGVEKGDEIEARRDPAIQRAVEALGG